MAETLIDVPLSQIKPSPTNPRQRFGDVAGLAKDIAARGVVQPVVARKRNGHYELTFGERRLRAAKRAKLKTLPVIVREQTDAEVVEAQIAENLERQDLHPMAQAEAFERLQKEHGYTLAKIAKIVRRKTDEIRKSCKLLSLCPALRKQFLEDRFSAEIAFLLARIPSPKLQVDAAEKLTEPGVLWDDSPAEAQRFVQQEYMRTLADAPFDVADASLLKAAPACHECPKRSGAQPVLFAELDNAGDQCLDRVCWKRKADATWQRAKKRAKDEDLEIIDGKKAEDLFYNGGVLTYLAERDYVDAAEVAEDVGSKKAWRTLLGEKAPKPILAKDRSGTVHELYPRNAVTEALKATGHKPPPKPADPDAAWKRKQKEARTLKKRRLKAAEEAIAAAVEMGWADVALLRVVANLLATGALLDQTAKRRGVTPDELRAKVADAKSTSMQDQEWLSGLVLELALRGRFTDWEPYGEAFEAAMDDLGVDLPAIEQLVAEEKAKAKSKGKRKKASGTKAKAER